MITITKERAIYKCSEQINLKSAELVNHEPSIWKMSDNSCYLGAPINIYIISISIHFTNCQISLTNILTYYCQKKGNCFSATRNPQNQDTARWFVLFVYHDKSFLTPWFVSKSVSKEGSLFLLISEYIFGNICFYVLELIFPNIFPAE